MTDVPIHTKSFPPLFHKDARLEAAYQKYAHRQRQKSLVLVNSADVLLKAIILLKVTCVLDDVGGGDDNEEEYEVEGDDGDGLLLERTCYLVSKN